MTRYHNSHRSLHWTSRQHQQRRYDVLSQIGNLTGKSVLDVGCGLGDFFAYLDAQSLVVDGTGYDIVDELLVLAKQNCPDIHFENRNIVLSPPNEHYDYVVTSGIFAFGDEFFFKSMVTAAYELADIAFGFNLYTTDWPDFYRPSRESVLAFCDSLAPSRIRVVDDYLPDDFSVFLYR